MAQLHPDTRRLIDLLSKIIKILKTNKKLQWEEWFKKDRAALEKGNHATVDHILQAFGGMGSFTDCVVPGPDGDDLLKLSDQLYNLATQLSKSHWRRQ